jgi:hypothetical protein
MTGNPSIEVVARSRVVRSEPNYRVADQLETVMDGLFLIASQVVDKRR